MHEIDLALTKHELVKVRVFSDDRAAREAMLAQVCADVDCAAVQHLGKIFVLWRPNPEKKKPAPAQPARTKQRKDHFTRGLTKKAGPARPSIPCASAGEPRRAKVAPCTAAKGGAVPRAMSRWPTIAPWRRRHCPRPARSPPTRPRPSRDRSPPSPIRARHGRRRSRRGPAPERGGGARAREPLNKSHAAALHGPMRMDARRATKVVAKPTRPRSTANGSPKGRGFSPSQPRATCSEVP